MGKGRRATTKTTRSRARDLFIVELRQRGNVSDAARVAGVDRTTPYGWRERSKTFAAAWDEALEEAIDRMEAEAYRRAVEGVEEPVYGRVGKDEDGQIGTIRKYSDTLMNTLLKAHRPEKYRERIDVTAKLLQMIDLNKLPPEQLERIANGEDPLAVLISPT